MRRIIAYQRDGLIRTGIGLEEVKGLVQQHNGLVWIDFENTPPEEDEPILREIFGFHPLAIEDALQQSHVPKLDDWESYLYIVLHSVVFDEAQGVVDSLELDVFLGSNYMVTHHDQRIPALDQVWESIQRDQRHLKNSADRLFCRLTEAVVTGYMPVVEALDEAIDRTEQEIFDSPSPATLARIFMLKRAAIRLRRVLSPQREVLNKLARDDFAVVERRTRVYFRDVYDHLVRLHDITESIRDLVSGALDTYLSVINNRMNDIMKTLTVITTLFMPISFLTGFFGMNFFAANPPYAFWTTLPVLVVVLMLLFLVPLGMFLWIRRRGWM